MNPEIKAKWLEALESGEYPKGKGGLRRPGKGAGGDTFCCLGVLCDLYAKETGHEWVDMPGYYRVFLGSDVFLPDEVVQWAEIYGIQNDANAYTQGELAYLNDYSEDFTEVIDYIKHKL